MAQFEIKNLSFSYPSDKERLILNDISMDIEAGEYVVLIGKSGSGKTTLLTQLKPVLAPFGERKGSILFDGRPIAELTGLEQASKIGYVMQNPDNQIVTDKVWHELAFGLENLGLPQNVIRSRVAEMASYFGIQTWMDRDVSELSGGKKQLLNLASIMAMRPEVLILDEPTSQLDPIAAVDFLNTVKKINLELGTTIIITEHRLEDIIHAADHAAVIEDGKLAAYDDPRRVSSFLHEKKDDLFVAMPAPVQIYYGADAGASQEHCPLTVREGRTWMSEVCRPQAAGTGAAKKTADAPGTKAAPADTFAPEAKTSEAIKNGGQTPAIELKNVWFRYDKDAPDVLKGTELTVPKGCIYAVVGGNGTGKSTMLKNLCRSLRPYRGQILIDGKKIEKYRGGELFKGKLAMLPQDPQSLFVKQTLREELEEMLGAKLAEEYERKVDIEGCDAVPLDARVKEVADLCGITHLMKHHPYDLSGGEQQRAALAKVLLTNPQILLLDEPTKGIDAFFKLRLAKLFADLKARGITILMVSHDIEFCAKYADYVGMFFDGGICASGRPQEFFAANSFYTTAANRMARHIFPQAVTVEQVVAAMNEEALG